MHIKNWLILLTDANTKWLMAINNAYYGVIFEKQRFTDEN